jgi:hypothetical protein
MKGSYLLWPGENNAILLSIDSYHKAVILGDTVKGMNTVRSVDTRWLYLVR